MKITYLRKISFATTVFVLAVISLSILAPTVRADDDEGEYEHEEREEREERRPVIQQPVAPPVMIQQPVVAPAQTSGTPAKNTSKVVTTIVNNQAALDALKDSDQDGIIDTYDKHPGQDDFSYLIVDKDQNGIADDLEKLVK